MDDAEYLLLHILIDRSLDSATLEAHFFHMKPVRPPHTQQYTFTGATAHIPSVIDLQMWFTNVIYKCDLQMWLSNFSRGISGQAIGRKIAPKI